ncbi:MAG: hypothetical protein IJM41_00725 [Bacteroidales bacterium]|nr:hypothetical protein [Bacteroidales bacterium]
MDKVLDIDQRVRETAEHNIKALSVALKQELAVNDAQTNPNRRVHTSLLIVRDEDCFIALDGSAHRMEGCFVELFEKRPELRSVVQGALDKLFRVEDR